MAMDLSDILPPLSETDQKLSRLGKALDRSVKGFITVPDPDDEGIVRVTIVPSREGDEETKFRQILARCGITKSGIKNTEAGLGLTFDVHIDKIDDMVAIMDGKPPSLSAMKAGGGIPVANMDKTTTSPDIKPSLN